MRGGGHSAAGLGVWDGALVVDLSLLRSTTVSPADHTVRADAGCTWGDVDHATVAFGMATPSGFLASTGVAGLTLGGGIGYLSRRFGLTVDNLLSADVVLADGTLRHRQRELSPRPVLGAARRRRELRHRHLVHVPLPRHRRPRHDHRRPGSLRHRRHRRGHALVPGAASVAARGAQRLDRADHHPARPAIPPGTVGPQGVRHRLVLHRLPRRADEVLEPARTFGSPLLAGLQPMPFSVLQSAFDGLYPAGLQWYWRADFFNEISDAAIAIHVKYGAQLPTGHSTMHMYPIDGAASRVPADATAFAYRDGGWAGVIVGVDPDPANAGLISQWARDYWQELHPASAGGAYVNFLMDEGQDRVKASYRGNYDRLAQVKHRYDPANTFHINQNIQPANAASP